MDAVFRGQMRLNDVALAQAILHSMNASRCGQT